MRKLLLILLLPALCLSQVAMSNGRTTIAGSAALTVGGDAALTIADNNGGVIKYDQYGNPNVMVWIPAFNWDHINEFSSTTLHPAFMVNGVAKSGIWVSKYENILLAPTTYAEYSAGTITGSSHSYIAASRANVSARYNIDFDAARKACTNMGTGWHLMTNSEWAAIALWSKNNSTMPYGNNSYGDDTDDPTVIGKLITGDTFGSGNSRWWTGSGGAKTGHNRTLDGVMDLNGNLWEWVDGMRLEDGLIYVAGNTNTSPTWAGNSFAATEANWYNTGMYVNWDGASSGFTLSAAGRGTAMPIYKAQYFGLTTGGDSLLAALALAPTTSSSSAYGNDYYYANNSGQRFPLRSGAWNSGGYAGVFYLSLRGGRSVTYLNIGFRSALAE